MVNDGQANNPNNCRTTKRRGTTRNAMTNQPRPEKQWWMIVNPMVQSTAAKRWGTPRDLMTTNDTRTKTMVNDGQSNGPNNNREQQKWGTTKMQTLCPWLGNKSVNRRPNAHMPQNAARAKYRTSKNLNLCRQ